MSRLDRYWIQELLMPTVLSTCIALFLLFANRILKLAPILVEADVSATPFLALMRFLVPPFLVVAAPIALYMSTILVSARIVRLGEWGAMRAAGISPLRATLPVLVLALVFSLLAEYFVWTLNPAGRAQFGKQLTTLVAINAHRTLAPNTVHDLKGSPKIYFESKDGADWIEPVFVLPESQSDAKKVVSARRAQVDFEGSVNSWVFRLFDGWVWSGNEQPFLEFDELELTMNPFGGISRSWTAVHESDWEQLQTIRQSDPRHSRNVEAEIHGRVLLAVQLFFLVLAALYVGIGDGNARHGKGESMFQGLLLFGLYYGLSTASRKLAVSWDGEVWVPMYGATLCFGLFCAFLYSKVLRQ